MKQTAVEWLVEQLRQLAHNPNTHIGMGDIRVTQGHLDQLEEQAKAMEKEQIIESHKQSSIESGFEDSAEDWANEYWERNFK